MYPSLNLIPCIKLKLLFQSHVTGTNFILYKCRCLRENGYEKSIVLDREFATSRSVLAAKRKELKAKGKGNRPNAVEPLTATDELLLREKG